MKKQALTIITLATLALGCDTEHRARQAWTTWWGISTLYVSGYTDGTVTINPRVDHPDCEAWATPAEADLVAQEIEAHQDTPTDVLFVLQSGDQVRVETSLLVGQWSTSMTATAGEADAAQYLCRMHIAPQAAWADIAADMHDAALYAAP